MDNVVLASQLVVGVSVGDGMGVHLVPPVEQPAEADLGVGHGAADGEGGAEGRGAGRGLVEPAGPQGGMLSAAATACFKSLGKLKLNVLLSNFWKS